MKIAIYGSRRQHDHLAKIESFMKSLADAGDEVVMHSKLYKYLVSLMPLALGAVTRVTDRGNFDADIVISIGGDGTFLRSAMWVGDKETPILGINTGHLGYLTSMPVACLPSLRMIIDDGSLTVSRRRLIEVVSPKLNIWPFALNEVTISKDDSASMIDANTTLNGVDLADYRADGLIVSTPTGSTAYNLSVGGPLIEPETPVWVLSPIAAHTLSMRPLVVSDSSHLTVCPDGRASHFRLTLDGRSTALDIGTTVELRRAAFDTLVMRPRDLDFATTLRMKLHWGVD